jgi:hypothetical protein
MRGLVAALLVCWALPVSAEPGTWQPGERTTATVRGEVGVRERRSDADGVYGRFDGDFDLGLGAGVEADRDAARGAARLSVHYFSMLGIVVGYSDALGDEAAIGRVLDASAELRPLFLPRWSKDLEQGPGALDLTLDSLSIGLGAFWVEPRGGTLGDVRGLELCAGFGIPLAGTSSGPWLEARGELRWPDPGRAPGAARADAVAVGLLSWHALWLSPLARAE